MDAQSSGGINQTQNPQANAPTIFGQTAGAVSNNNTPATLNTSATAAGISLNSTTTTTGSSLTVTPPPPKNYTTAYIVTGIFVIVIIFSAIFMRMAKKSTYAY